MIGRLTKLDGTKVDGSMKVLNSGVVFVERADDVAGKDGIDNNDLCFSPVAWLQIEILGTGDVPKEEKPEDGEKHEND